MHDGANVRPVDAHAERVGRDHHVEGSIGEAPIDVLTHGSRRAPRGTPPRASPLWRSRPRASRCCAVVAAYTIAPPCGLARLTERAAQRPECQLAPLGGVVALDDGQRWRLGREKPRKITALRSEPSPSRFLNFLTHDRRGRCRASDEHAAAGSVRSPRRCAGKMDGNRDPTARLQCASSMASSGGRSLARLDRRATATRGALAPRRRAGNDLSKMSRSRRLTSSRIERRRQVRGRDATLGECAHLVFHEGDQRGKSRSMCPSSTAAGSW